MDVFRMMRVHAAEETKSNKIKICELPLYSTPVTECQYEIVPKEISSFRSGISELRKGSQVYLDSIQSTVETAKRKWNVSKEHTKELVTYIQEDPALLPRASVITVAGLGGIVAGYRGGLFRKLFLSASFVTAATALCYPKEAVALSTEIYDTGYNAIKPMIDSITGNQTTTETKVKVVAKPEDKQPDVKTESSSTEKTK